MLQEEQRILVIEDAEESQVVIENTLKALGYKVSIASDAAQAFSLLKQENFQLILLDVMLPDQSGFSVCAKIQEDKETQDIPIFFLTGKSSITDKVTAFSLGAEDYIIKPFDPLELRVRVEAKLRKRREKKEQNSVLKIRNLKIDITMHHVLLMDDKGLETELDLTPLEFKLLFQLARRPNQVFTRDQLLASVWGDSKNVCDRTVDTHICALRRKLGVCSEYIESVQSVGYKFRAH